MDTLASSSQLPSPTESNDIFSLTDQVLSDRLEFIEEIGFGNWGSVWLCRPKPATTADGVVKPLGQKLAVKLVHRSKTSTTAARVRSLWNEMKIVRSFKSDPHPSIIPFHSFIITPSYALITMTYHPTLVPVEVDESKAREWFRYLLSGVEFLHQRGVVHNDIKPANILISYKNIPVLVDFGFAEKYEMDSDTAFHSNLSYGTPEYLSPERARGLPHDTRKSDVWSLGVTFFEILVGRTPFEHSDGEQFNSTDDLEKYWSRTLRGKWVGTWEFSKGIEKLLQRMIAPNADLRCTATQAMKDSYWQTTRADAQVAIHKRASSYTSAALFEKDMERLLNMTPSSKAKENAQIDLQSPPGLVADRSDIFRDHNQQEPVRARPTLAKSRSQPKVASRLAQPKKRNLAPAVIDLSPIKASPTTPKITTATAKQNITAFNRLASVADRDKKKQEKKENVDANGNVNGNVPNSGRKPFTTLGARDNNIPRAVLAKKPSGNTYGAKAAKVLGEMNAYASVNVSAVDIIPTTKHGKNASFSTPDKENQSVSLANTSKDSSHVRDRVREWEREKERLREMARLEEMEKERDEILKKEKKERKERKEQEKRERDEQERSRREKEEEEARQRELEELQRQRKGALEILGGSDEDDRRVSTEQERRNASLLKIKLPAPSKLSTAAREWDHDKENVKVARSPSSPPSAATSPILSRFRPQPFGTQVMNVKTSIDSHVIASPKPVKEGKNIFKHSIRASIDKTMQFYKSSTVGGVTSGRTTPAHGFSFDISRPGTAAGNGTPHNEHQQHAVKGSTRSGKDFWDVVVPEADGSIPEISPLPVIRNAAENERIAADSRMDRMTIWMKNVEKVVEDAKQNFAASTSPVDLPLPPLPVPLARNHSQTRPSRLPRRVLAASQIFQSDENGNITPMIEHSMMSAGNLSAYQTANSTNNGSTGPAVVEFSSPTRRASTSSAVRDDSANQSQLVIPEIHTPSRQRRATVSTSSPGPESPSKKKEKSRSHGNLFQRHIAPIAVLEAELAKPPPPVTTPRLSEVLDRSLFIAPKLASRDNLLEADSFERGRETSFDELTSSPLQVEAYPQRTRASYDHPIPDTPSRHRIEGVYDRFLMATSGVKRVGKGYQSDNVGPVAGNAPRSSLQAQGRHRAFYTTRKPMPPPVSSDDLLKTRAASVDELGMMHYGVLDIASPSQKEEGHGTVALMRKAIKLMVPKNNTMSKRLSRMG